MSTLFWVLIVLHVFLCFFLALLVLVQNDKMGGLAGLGGMTSQSAFSTAGAATFIQKLTRVVAVIFFIVAFGLGLITAKQDQVVEESAMQKATRESAAEQAEETQAYVRSVVKEIYGEAVAEGMRIQYGGSMKGANAAGLLAQKDIDGGLIGGAGLKANTFKEIIDAAEAK